MYINKLDGMPFATKRVAEMRAAQLKIQPQDYETVKVDGGYSILSKVPREVKTADTSREVTESVQIEQLDDWNAPNEMFSIIDPFKEHGFVYKWASPSMKQGSRIAELQHQGWQVDAKMYKKIRHLSFFRDNGGKNMGTETMIFGHLLMRLSIKGKEKRDEHFRRLTNAGLKAEQDKLTNQVGKKNIYGNVNVT